MKASKFLAVILAALFPALGCAKMVTYSYPAVIQSPTDGMLFTASKQRLFHEALDNVHYSVKVLDGCQAYCDLEGINNCDNPLDSFNVVAQCADYRGKENFLKEVGASRKCNKNESLSVYLKAPLKTQASVSVEIEITFDSEAPNALEISEKLEPYFAKDPRVIAETERFNREYREERARLEAKLQEEKAELRRLEAERDAAHRAAVRAIAEHERAVAEREQATAEREQAEAAVRQADIELQQASAAYNASQQAYNASKRELINSLEAYTAELQSACEQMFQ